MTTLSRNLVFNIVGQGLALIVSFVAVRFIFRQLGSDAFGIIYFNLTLAAVLTTVLELGILATTVREVSSHFDSEPDYIRSLIRTASSLYWGLSIVVVTAVVVAAPLLVQHWINLTTLDTQSAATLLRILSIGTMVALPRALYTSLFRGRQRMAINNSIDVVTAVVQQLGVLGLLKIGASLFVVAAWLSASVLLAVVVYMVWVARLFGWRCLLPAFDRTTVRRNVRFTSLMLSNSLLATALSSTDKLAVSKLMTVSQFGLYGFAAATVGRSNMLSAAIGQAALPSFASLHKSGDHGALLRQYHKLQDLVSFGTLPVFAAISFAALPAYTYLFDSESARLLLLPTAFLCLGFYFAAVLYTPYIASVAVGKPQIVVRANVIGVVLVVPVTIALVLAFGLSGAAFSWVFYQLFALAYVAPRISRDCLGLPPLAWYVQLAKAFLPGVAVYLAAWTALNALTGPSLAPIVLSYVAASAAYAVCAFALIGADTRATVMRAVGATQRTFGYPAKPSRSVPENPLTSPPPAFSRTNFVVAGAGVGLGLACGLLVYFDPRWSPEAMAVAVFATAAIFVNRLGWASGLVTLLIATSMIVRFTFRVGQYDLRPEQVAAALAIGVLALERIRARRWDWLRPSTSELLLLGWFATGLVASTTTAPSHAQSLKVLAVIVISASAIFLPRRLIEKRTDLEVVIRWLLLAFALESAYAVAVYFLHLFGPSIAISVNPAGGHLNGYGTLWEPNVLGAVAGAGALAWSFLGPTRFRHAWIGAALCFAACVVSVTRAALLATVVVFFLSLFLPRPYRFDLRTAILGLAGGVVCLVALAGADAVGHYTVGTSNAIGSVGNSTDLIGRLDQFGPVFKDLAANPILGGGLASFGQRHVVQGLQAHLANVLLSVVNDTGIVGLSLFALSAMVVLVNAWRRRFDREVLGLFAMVMVIVITNQATETLELMITWLLVGVAVSAVQIARREADVSELSLARTAPGIGS